jgi:hypothetical protein
MSHDMRDLAIQEKDAGPIGIMLRPFLVKGLRQGGGLLAESRQDQKAGQKAAEKDDGEVGHVGIGFR